jgi:hypothetical protein
MAMLRVEFKNPLFLAFVSCVLFFTWFFLTAINATLYQDSAGTDPLAMIHVLFPYFWVLLLAFVGVCFVAFLKFGDNRLLHMLLLSQLALMLYFTPFLLSGFSWSPDSLWHAGVADYMPQILSGDKIVLTQYAQAYPFSFLLTYFARHVLGFGLIDYTLYVYPTICIVAITTLAYFFAARILSSKVAFLSMLFTLPALHYIEPHVSPFSTGTVLVFLSFVLLTYKSRLALSLSLASILLLVFTHPISPIVLGIFLFAIFIVSFVFRKREYSHLTISNAPILPIFVILGTVWFYWIIFHAMWVYSGVNATIMNVFNLNFLSRVLSASEFTVGGQAFFYSWIHDLGLLVYAIFLLLTMIPLVADLKQLFARKEKRKQEAIIYKRIILILAAILYAVMGFMLFLASGERFLLGRGLLFFIFMGSLAVATYFVGISRFGNRVKNLVALGIIVFLACTFPLVSYSKEAYNTFTPAAESGLSFLSASGILVNRTISIGAPQQLAAYANLSQGLNYIKSFPPDLAAQTVDVVVLRVNSYFVISMRYDLSFENNSYTELRDYLEDSQLYNKVYSNSEFEVYCLPS